MPAVLNNSYGFDYIKFGIREYLVSINPPMYDNFVVAYDKDDKMITDQEVMNQYIGRVVACIFFSDAGQIYRRYYAKLISAEIVRDTRLDRDSWSIQVDPFYETEVISQLNNDILK